MAAKKRNTEQEPEKKGGIARRLWFSVAVVFVVVTSYVIIRNAIVVADYHWRIGRLNKEKAEYQRRITADSLLIEQLKHNDFLEKYARERYRMHRADEQVFITE